MTNATTKMMKATRSISTPLLRINEPVDYVPALYSEAGDPHGHRYGVPAPMKIEAGTEDKSVDETHGRKSTATVPVKRLGLRWLFVKTYLKVGLIVMFIGFLFGWR